MSVCRWPSCSGYEGNLAKEARLTPSRLLSGARRHQAGQPRLIGVLPSCAGTCWVKCRPPACRAAGMILLALTQRGLECSIRVRRQTDRERCGHSGRSVRRPWRADGHNADTQPSTRTAVSRPMPLHGGANWRAGEGNPWKSFLKELHQAKPTLGLSCSRHVGSSCSPAHGLALRWMREQGGSDGPNIKNVVQTERRLAEAARAGGSIGNKACRCEGTKAGEEGARRGSPVATNDRERILDKNCLRADRKRSHCV